ncbi:AAA family ATPase [Pseudoalteromonas gelatinilytica]
MSNSGAKAALKGYRLQTLYILHEILQSRDSELIFQPEGNEDLAVYQGEKIVRAVQVKALNVPLTLSHFIEPEKKDTFIHRSLDLLYGKESPRVEIVSFGEIGNELASAWSKSDSNREINQGKIRKKLTNLKISDSQVDRLFECLVWHPVVEDELSRKVSKYLSKTLTSGSIEHALSLLTSWLYVASENRTKITHKMLFEKISSIGQYFAEREAHHLEWFKSITPLDNKKDIENIELEKEFYRGVSTRFSHIQANLDTIRQSQLTAIDNKFENSQTIIVHGASGQGKTTLAYRYLYEYVPESWRLQINFIEDRIHAQSIALAIADQLAIFDATLYLFIDVTPRDPDWTALVKALLERPNIKILVSIREEDLARQNISNDQLGFPELVQLNLSQEEAKHIYFNLIEKGVAKPYPSFEQAWLGFGGNGSCWNMCSFLLKLSLLEKSLGVRLVV